MNCLMVMAPEDPGPSKLTCVAPPNLPDSPRQWGAVGRHVWWGGARSVGWSPDGARLAWTIPVAGKRRVELRIVDRAAGEHQVAFAGEENYYTMPVGARWSYDDRWIATNLVWYPNHEIERLTNVLAKLTKPPPASRASTGR